MPEILFRWNYYTKSWEVYSLSLQSWQLSGSLRDSMTEEEVRAYFLQFGREARRWEPVTYAQGQQEAMKVFGCLSQIADQNERAFNEREV